MEFTTAQIEQIAQPVVDMMKGRNDTVAMVLIVAAFVLAILWIGKQYTREMIVKFTDFLSAESDKHDAAIQRIEDDCHKSFMQVMSDAKDTAVLHSESLKNLTESFKTVNDTAQKNAIVMERVIRRLDGDKTPRTI